MKSLQTIKAWISAPMSLILVLASQAFAALFPIAARPRVRIPRGVAGSWQHYRPGHFRSSRLQA